MARQLNRKIEVGRRIQAEEMRLEKQIEEQKRKKAEEELERMRVQKEKERQKLKAMNDLSLLFSTRFF